MRNFKQARTDAELTQVEIGRRLGVTVQTVYKWERGLAPVARRRWSALAAMFKISADELERCLVQTLLDSCMERGSMDALKNAVVSGVYRTELLQDAFSRYNVYPPTAAPPPVAPPSSLTEKEKLDYEREIVRLREENVKLREELLKLRERLSPSPRPSTSLESTIIVESEVKK